VLAAAVITAMFFWQGHLGFSLWDEGFLWYGVQRVLAGEVPFRDFMSYDPGRYYWSGALMALWGDHGIVSLRKAVAVFQFAGLGIGLWTLQRATPRPGLTFLVLSAAVLTAWMFPRHKLFDISLSIILIATLAYLGENSSTRRYFVAGLVLGMVAVFGRNHGIYGLSGSIVAIFLIEVTQRFPIGFFKRILAWINGILLGFSPIILMSVLIPGFSEAFIDSVLYLLQIKTTNLPLPVPWPWKADFSSLPLWYAVQNLLVGLFFVAIVCFAVIGLSVTAWRAAQGRPIEPILLACACLALPYAHYAYSRADVGHLAQGIFPFLLGTLAVIATLKIPYKWLAGIFLLTASIYTMRIHHPAWLCNQPDQCAKQKIGIDTLFVDRATAEDIHILQNIIARFAPHGEPFVITPFWPGAYAITETKAPMWAIYALWHRGEMFERQEIERIRTANPAFILLIDLPLDGRDAMRFARTHPFVYGFIQANYRVADFQSKPGYIVYIPKDLKN
jgi:hypothetical protein